MLATWSNPFTCCEAPLLAIVLAWHPLQWVKFGRKPINPVEKTVLLIDICRPIEIFHPFIDPFHFSTVFIHFRRLNVRITLRGPTLTFTGSTCFAGPHTFVIHSHRRGNFFFTYNRTSRQMSEKNFLGHSPVVCVAILVIFALHATTPRRPLCRRVSGGVHVLLARMCTSAGLSLNHLNALGQ